MTHKNEKFSETELEKNNNLGKCCEFLKVDSGLTYSGTYELNKGMIFIKNWRHGPRFDPQR